MERRVVVYGYEATMSPPDEASGKVWEQVARRAPRILALAAKTLWQMGILNMGTSGDHYYMGNNRTIGELPATEWNRATRNGDWNWASAV